MTSNYRNESNHELININLDNEDERMEVNAIIREIENTNNIRVIRSSVSCLGTRLKPYSLSFRSQNQSDLQG